MTPLREPVRDGRHRRRHKRTSFAKYLISRSCADLSVEKVAYSECNCDQCSPEYCNTLHYLLRKFVKPIQDEHGRASHKKHEGYDQNCDSHGTPCQQTGPKGCSTHKWCHPEAHAVWITRACNLTLKIQRCHRKEDISKLLIPLPRKALKRIVTRIAPIAKPAPNPAKAVPKVAHNSLKHPNSGETPK